MYTTNSELGTTTVPAFLSKLWTLVEDPSTNELICWDITGKSFHVLDQARFAKEILPLYFKHNNMASFIRQLNMYGFRKVMTVEAANIKMEKDDVEFAHPYFVQGQEGLLEYIKRKAANTKLGDSGHNVGHVTEDLSKVCADLTAVKGKQETITSNLEHLKIENEVLWKEVVALRQRHLKQERIVNKLIQFLVTLVGDRTISSMKRKLPLMLEDATDSDNSPAAKVSKTKDEQMPSSSGLPLNSLTGDDNMEPLAILKDGDAPTLQLTDFLEEVDENPIEGLFTSPDPQIDGQNLGLTAMEDLPIPSTSSSLGSLKPVVSDVSSVVDSATQLPSSVTTVARTVPAMSSEFNRDRVAENLESTQNLIDSVQGLMSSNQYSNFFDTSTLYELFNPEPTSLLSNPKVLYSPDVPYLSTPSWLLEDDEAEPTGLENSKPKNDTNGAVVGNELMQYNPKENFDVLLEQLMGDSPSFSNPVPSSSSSSAYPDQNTLEDILGANELLFDLDRTSCQ